MGADQFTVENGLAAQALQAATVAPIANEAWADGYVLQFSSVDGKLHLVALPSGGLTFVSVNAPLTGNGTPGSPLGVSPASGVAAGSMSAAAFNQLAALPSALALPVSVANGGTGTNTLAAHGVLLGNGTSPLAIAGPSSAIGKILTSNGLSLDPTFEAPITATNSSATLAVSPFNIPTTGAWTDIGLDLLLEPGQHEITVDALGLCKTATPATGDEGTIMRLYDATGGVAIANSERPLCLIDEATLGGFRQGTLTEIVTLSVSSSIRVQAADVGGSTALSISQVRSNTSSGQTRIVAVKIGN